MKIHKIFYFLVLIGIVIALFAFVVSFLYVFSFANNLPSVDNLKKLERKDCAVVFGAGVLPGGVAGSALQSRSKTAALLYKNGVVSCVILSGFQSSFGAHEVDAMRDVLINNGVSANDMEFDFDAENTLQTVKNLNKNRSYVLVSNDFHLARINMFAKREGLRDFYLIPSVNKIQTHSLWYWFMREAVAILYYTTLNFMR